MIKIVDNIRKAFTQVKDMKPLQLGYITDAGCHHGKLVMRTASVYSFEVMILHPSGPNQCWVNDNCSLFIRLLEPGEKVTIELSND